MDRGRCLEEEVNDGRRLTPASAVEAMMKVDSEGRKSDIM